MANKDSIVYFVDILRQHAEKALDILSDTIFNPIISESELEEVKSIIQFQNVMSSADAISREAALVAAYAGTSLGNSHICPLERVELVDRSILEDFRSKYYFAENCIIPGVDIDVSSFVDFCFLSATFKQVSVYRMRLYIYIPPIAIFELVHNYSLLPLFFSVALVISFC